MKSNIHPKWRNDVEVSCACGNQFKAGSTLESIHVDICSQCHPFYTGEMKFVDVQGRVEKFQAKQKKGASYRAKNKRTARSSSSQQPVQSLKEMLTNIKRTTDNSPADKAQ